MTTDNSVVELQDVSLCYRLAKQKIPSLKEYLIHFIKGSLDHEELWALRGLTMTVGKGETVGIVGRNGAGKSTLLKVVSGVLKPTEGSVRCEGWIAPILELGTGFDFELTGYENIYLNALLLGRQESEVDEKIDEIIEFSGLGDFIRSPIRNYSSGMQARLGFAIATAWTPDVLILDEVLAVGDARFLHRCKSRFEEFHEAGTTILIVSHDEEAIRENCQRGIWLDEGRILADGPVDEVLDRYQQFSEGTEAGEPDAVVTHP